MSPGIYIHIPFCLKKCDYCGFVSACPDTIPEKEYTQCLITEIESVTNKLYPVKTKCGSIYFGGGTPSLFSPESISKIIAKLHDLYDVDSGAEITLEANPKTADIEKLKGFREAGINRLSIGTQSFNDNILKALGRIHNKSDALQMYDNAREAGFDNINLDIIFGVPAQSKEILEADLKTLAELNPEHISAYSLTVEGNTPLFTRVQEGLKVPDDDEVADMFIMVEEFLTENGYKHYEISNYCKAGRGSQHNMNYWRYGEYIGFGAAAHSLFKGKPDAGLFAPYADGLSKSGHLRWCNVKEHQEYMEKVKAAGQAFSSVESITRSMRMTEFMIMGLRLSDGIRLKDFQDEFGEAITDVYGKSIKELTDSELIEIKNNSLKLTKKGVLLTNEVLINIIQ